MCEKSCYIIEYVVIGCVRGHVWEVMLHYRVCCNRLCEKSCYIIEYVVIGCVRGHVVVAVL